MGNRSRVQLGQEAMGVITGAVKLFLCFLFVLSGVCKLTPKVNAAGGISLKNCNVVQVFGPNKKEKFERS